MLRSNLERDTRHDAETSQEPHAADPAHCMVLRPGLVEYTKAWKLQQALVERCRTDAAARLLLLERPPTYTLGARGKTEHLLADDNALTEIGAVVARSDRGGDVTFHGPGQLVGYPIIDLSKWGQGPLWYVRSLQRMLIEALATFGIEGERRPGQPGAVGWGKEDRVDWGARVSRHHESRLCAERRPGPFILLPYRPVRFA